MVYCGLWSRKDNFDIPMETWGIVTQTELNEHFSYKYSTQLRTEKLD